MIPAEDRGTRQEGARRWRLAGVRLPARRRSEYSTKLEEYRRFRGRARADWRKCRSAGRPATAIQPPLETPASYPVRSTADQYRDRPIPRVLRQYHGEIR